MKLKGTLDTDTYLALPFEVRQRFDTWLAVENLASLGVKEVQFNEIDQPTTIRARVVIQPVQPNPEDPLRRARTEWRTLTVSGMPDERLADHLIEEIGSDSLHTS